MYAIAAKISIPNGIPSPSATFLVVVTPGCAGGWLVVVGFAAGGALLNELVALVQPPPFVQLLVEAGRVHDTEGLMLKELRSESFHLTSIAIAVAMN